MKLFESIMKNFDDDSLGLLGAVLGEHEVKVRDGVEAAVPEILCAIGAKTKSEEGRGMLWRELRDADQGVASAFPSQLHYQNSLGLVENGKQQLSGLIGNDMDAITTRVSHAADIGSSSASKMVGAVSPLIFSSLAAWQKKENVDAAGWQKLFADQDEGLRERAVRSATRRFDAKTGQRTFPSFDKTIATEQGSGDEKWTASSGFTPGYTGSAKEKFQASGLTPDSPKTDTPKTGKGASIAAGAAGAAAVAGVAAAGGKAMGAKTTGTTTTGSGSTTSGSGYTTTGSTTSGSATSGAASSGSTKWAATAPGAKSSAAAQANSLTSNAASTSNSLQAEPTTGDTVDLPRWVPDKENLKRERERTAIERASTQREAKLAQEKSGGLGWLWWQLALLAAVAGVGWFYRGEISEFVNTSTPVASDVVNNSTAPIEKVEGDLSEDANPMLPSEESSETVGGTDSQIGEISAVESTAPQEASSTNRVAEASAPSDVVEGSLQTSAVEGSAVEGSTVGGSTIEGSAVGSSVVEGSMVEGSSAGSSMIEGATTESESPQLSSPPPAPGTVLDSSGTLQREDAPMFAPMAGPDDTNTIESSVESSASQSSASQGSETVVTDLTIEGSETVVIGSAPGEDVDLQVETALTSLELNVKNIKDEASALSALPKMEESVTSLENILQTSSTWGDVDKELIDIQLEEAAEMFGELNKSVSSIPNVKNVVTPVFERLDKVLETKPVAP